MATETLMAPTTAINDSQSYNFPIDDRLHQNSGNKMNPEAANRMPTKNETEQAGSDDCFSQITKNEKPNHLGYLKNFRVNQCPLFLQHKCTQHRPFTCFNWHFQNQRRRRPIQRADKPFNYSPDIYCNKYDETTGTCVDGDSCAYLHRVTGDTERRYHLRYYKTAACIHETDENGHCEKNGPHCAFGHGADDLRSPTFDASCGIEVSSKGDLQEKLSLDDNKWNNADFVLSNYKTDTCKRPPRLCRQGYACPHFHNPKDRRRNPKKFKYRSTPCPAVKKVGDDWQDPAKCEKGDSCCMCHTRTEQQFHPDIYKSTKCHDMQQTGYCPRGPFCAFAHVEQLDEDGEIGGQGKMRIRTSSDAQFELARQRRRDQLEARNMRHSVSGSEGGRGRTQSFSNFRNNGDGSLKTAKVSNWGRTSQEIPRPQRQAETNQPSIDIPQPKIWNNNSGITAQSPSSPSVASNSPKFESPRRRDAHEDHKSSRWPPHPEDEEKTRESDPWSPDVFREITDINEFHNETQEEEAKSGYFGPAQPHETALVDEFSRRRTQSANYSFNEGNIWRKDSPPSRSFNDWTNFSNNLRGVAGSNGIGSSSPISIQNSLNSQNSITTAIRNSVLQGNDGSSHSRSFNEELLQQENMKLKKDLYNAENAYRQLEKNARRQSDFYKSEYDKARKHIMDQSRELDQLREAMRNVAAGRVIAEIRNAQRTEYRKSTKVDAWKRKNPDIVRGKEKERRERLTKAFLNMQGLLPISYLETCIAKIKVGTPGVQKNINKDLKTWKIPNYLLCEMVIEYLQAVTQELTKLKQVSTTSSSTQTITYKTDRDVQVKPTCVSSITQTDVYPKSVECQTASLDSPSKSSKQFNINHLISEASCRKGLTVARPWDMNIHKSPIKSTVKKKLFSPAVDMSGAAETNKTQRAHKSVPKQPKSRERKRDASSWDTRPVSKYQKPSNKNSAGFDSTFSIDSLTNPYIHQLNEFPVTPIPATNYFSNEKSQQQSRKHMPAPIYSQPSAQSFSNNFQMGEAPLDCLSWPISEWGVNQPGQNWADPNFFYALQLDYNESNSNMSMHPNTSNIPHNISHILNN
ncbi:Oidioi.mRNA.OKI2018_I69.XSR.g15748.t1.cds [Oikopleura dioica]|uniref:Oidioi.mRNA.OKI2018_I69.XSR.g15748.t1.cds n=1 Tax=Oikopleura dioica TaxID=34765 RepID=A0ABN7SDU3_OIKDI|nr:Oidioi.mRNA.OKI2018_I69.XSR.g15748.t1.cds [Oikopleura dioica]